MSGRESGRLLARRSFLMVANLVPNARLVPAGIVEVNRAQERGYALVSVEH